MHDTPLSNLVPNQAGALWIGLLVAAVVLADFERLASRRNLVVLGLLALAPCLVNVVHAKGDRAARTFEAIFVLTAVNAVWALRTAFAGAADGLRPNLPRAGLRIVVAVVLLCNVATALGRHPDDAGYYTNLGAQRWRETGVLPYADPKLKGRDGPGHGAATTYGPMLYVAHVPFQVLVGTPENPPDADLKDGSRYAFPPVLATQLTCLAFHAIGIAALFLALRRLAGEEAGLAAVALYAGSPYVTGLGGERELIGGLAYISHIAPSAITLLAFLVRGRPAVCGAVLAASAGLLYYPAFFVPLWCGWFLFGQGGSRGASLRFLAGFAVAGAAIAAFVHAFTPALDGKGTVALFLESTLEHQEGTGASEYGASTCSFWGTHPGLADTFHSPIFGSGSLFKPTFLAFAALSAAGFLLARGRSAVQLAALTAMLAAAVQLWKTHATGSYVEWYLPFLLIGLLGSQGETAPRNGAATAPG